MDGHNTAEDWLVQALTYTAAPCHGVPGPLTEIKPRPGDPPASGEPHYRLADYLEQVGGRQRAGVFPPAGFWAAAATVITDPDVLYEVGEQAHRRGRYHRAALLYRQAAEPGDTRALAHLASLRQRAGDHAGADVFSGVPEWSATSTLAPPP